MISLSTAQKLKSSGLIWAPAHLDCFGIPDRGMDEKVFVISDMLATIDSLQGFPVVAFQGASEWALDAIVTSEVVWLPSEEQLRTALLGGLLEFGSASLRLEINLGGCCLTILVEGGSLRFENADASEAYAAGLLYLMERRAQKDVNGS